VDQRVERVRQRRMKHQSTHKVGINEIQSKEGSQS
jgi:hypothetical protein